MDLNLRNAILSNVSGYNEEQISNTIMDAIQNGEEKMLPGLGVLFEVMWKEASDQDKQMVLQTISQGLAK